MQQTGFDIIGDVHGQLTALRELGRLLGYDVEGDWSHPQGRSLVFLGDLIDGGSQSLEVGELVADLAARGQALCLMGNHEYSLVRYCQRQAEVKRWNQETVADLHARPERWERVISFFCRLPLALELPQLRVVHAMWEAASITALQSVLQPRGGPQAEAGHPLASGIVLESPFDGKGQLRRGVPREPVVPSTDLRHEVLFKGLERWTPLSFRDADGQSRHNVCVPWWLEAEGTVPTDKRTVFGHYENLPPTYSLHGSFVPPLPTGHPLMTEWQTRVAREVTHPGKAVVPEETLWVCVDYYGLSRAGRGACVGAYRWPEQEILWTGEG